MSAARAARPSTWDDRIARARTLAESRAAAAELLTFYAELAEVQQSLPGDDEAGAATDGDGGVAAASPFFAALDLERVLDAVPPLLSWLSQAAPRFAPADASRRIDRDGWRALLLSFIGDLHDADLTDDRAAGAPAPEFESPGVAAIGAGAEPVEALVPFVLESVLQPFAEQRARRLSAAAPLDSRPPLRCPRCGGPPVAAVLREEGQGARRFLLCAICLTEWPCLRIVCARCGEQTFERLPIFTAEQFAHVRIDACDNCHHYVKAVDLSRDGLAVPYVDDIASVSLDLWARDKGYRRIRRNVLQL